MYLTRESLVSLIIALFELTTAIILYKLCKKIKKEKW